jgi:hypothetical protein
MEKRKKGEWVLAPSPDPFFFGAPFFLMVKKEWREQKRAMDSHTLCADETLSVFNETE